MQKNNSEKTSVSTIDLFTAADVKRVKQLLYKEQEGKCALSGVEMDIRDSHTDHKHDSEQLVRGTLHKQANMALGKLEGLWTRYLAYWYPGTLPEFLRASAAYIERTEASPDTRFRHPGWIKFCRTQFNKLSAKRMDDVLVELGSTPGKNLVERKAKFAKVVLDRNLGYNTILNVIKKGNT